MCSFLPTQRGTKANPKTENFLGRVIRDIKRKRQTPDESLSNLLALAERILSQTRHDTNKVYSVHAPEVEYTAKGKAFRMIPSCNRLRLRNSWLFSKVPLTPVRDRLTRPESATQAALRKSRQKAVCSSNRLDLTNHTQKILPANIAGKAFLFISNY
jgi:hypothetical protein